ncbi:MAG: amidohydrolase family protein, partial [Candidatus Paceibacteria bacterium]
MNWLTVKEYYQELQRRSLRVNYGTLIGYLTVRRGLLHDEFRPVTDEELDALLKLVEDGFKEGALGVSFGLAYSHLYMDDHSELRAVAQLTADYDRILTVHMRDEGSGIVDSVKEVIQLTRETGVRTEISHLKILGEKNWNMFEQVLELISEAREEGLPLEVDIFPYRANNGVLYLQLPYWVTKGGKEQMLERLQDPETKNKVIAEMKRNSEDYSRMVISSAPGNQRFVGKTVTEVAHNQGVGIEEAILNLIIATNSQITTLNYAIKPQHVSTLAEQPFTTIGSDGVGYSDDIFRQQTAVHPRSFGAFPRFWNLSQIELSPEERIFRMTGKPAAHYNLHKRGQLKKGYQADILMFDPEAFTSDATLDDPLVYTNGVREV